jgi:hypothetical protein
MPFNLGDPATVAFAHLVGDPDPDRVIVRFGDDLALAPAEDEAIENDPVDVRARLMACCPPLCELELNGARCGGSIVSTQGASRAVPAPPSFHLRRTISASSRTHS